MLIHGVLDEFDYICELLEKKDTNQIKLFNIFYINYAKAYELCMLLNNTITTRKENKYRKESSEKANSGFSLNSSNTLLATNLNDESIITNSYEYAEIQEVINSNSTYLKKIIDISENKINFKQLKRGSLINLKNVKFKIINKEEIIQVKSMISGILNGNKISTDANGQQLDFDINSLGKVILKDYKYQLLCKTEDNTKFYISIPMKIEKEFQNNYSIFDLEIGKLDLIGTYSTGTFSLNGNSTWDYFNNSDSETDIIDSQQENDLPKKTDYATLPYIDVIAIIQNIEFTKENSK